MAFRHTILNREALMALGMDDKVPESFLFGTLVAFRHTILNREALMAFGMDDKCS